MAAAENFNVGYLLPAASCGLKFHNQFLRILDRVDNPIAVAVADFVSRSGLKEKANRRGMGGSSRH